MTVEQILIPIINEEFRKYEQQGYKIKLKSTNKIRTKYTLLSLLFLIIFFPVFPLVIIVYVLMMIKTTNQDIIIKLAKKNPDKPIVDIIAEEIKYE